MSFPDRAAPNLGGPKTPPGSLVEGSYQASVAQRISDSTTSADGCPVHEHVVEAGLEEYEVVRAPVDLRAI